MKFLITSGFFGIVLATTLFTGIDVSLAQQPVDVGLDAVGQEIGLGTRDIRVTIASIIRVFLGILGIVAVIIVLYGGFIWMTAAGNEEKVAKARKILISGTIGLVIILTSYAIASFVVGSLMRATGGQGGVAQQGPGGPGGPFGPGPGGAGLPADAFIVNSFSPQGHVSVRNVIVRIVFNRTIDQSSIAGNIFVRRVDNNEVVQGNFQVNDKTISFIPNSKCPAPNDQLDCFAANTAFRVSVAGGITGVKSSAGKQLTCTNAVPCVAMFDVGDIIDAQAPTISMIEPGIGASIAPDQLVSVRAQATDDAGISQINFFVNNTFLDTSAPFGQTVQNFIGQVMWDTEGLLPGSTHQLKARAFDIDNHETESASISVTVRAPHCFNQVQDEDEIGVDCGGSACGACVGASCQQNSDCQNHLCINGICVNAPVITSIMPDNGAVGNFITISGKDFGTNAGEVVFLGNDGDADDVIAPIAALCAGNAWQPHQAIVEIPPNAISGPIRLIEKTSGQNLWDDTVNARGYVGNMVINDVIRPALCSVSPSNGIFQERITLLGKNFGTQRDRVLFGGISSINETQMNWTDTQITQVTIPNMVASQTQVWVAVGNELSNPVSFTVNNVGVSPTISVLSPNQGSPGQYVTISGMNFGNTVGLVEFVSPVHGTVAADVNFPALCQSTYWSSDQVIVKVPNISVNQRGNYQIKVTSANGLSSETKEFEVNNAPVQPGICGISPNNGPVNTPVQIIGDGFGSSQGSVVFSTNEQASIQSWQSSQIQSIVPQSATTGFMQVVNNANILSNRVSFAVNNCLNGLACGSGEQCCQDGVCRASGMCQQNAPQDAYRWSFTTGDIPIPLDVISAFPNCSDACINALLGARFSTGLNTQTVNETSIQLFQCLNGQQCTNTTPLVILSPTYIEDAQNGIFEVNFMPQAGLNSSTWYRIVLTDAIRSNQGFSFTSKNYDRDGNGELDSVSWVFQTRAGNQVCLLDDISVIPSQYLAQTRNAHISYDLEIVSPSDACNVNGQRLSPASYSWQWHISSSNIAEFDPNILPDSHKQDIITKNQGQTAVIASTQNKQGQGLLEVDLQEPEIHSITPNDGLVRSDLITTYVTIKGKNFGNQPTNQRNVFFNQTAINKQRCFSWKDDEIVVGVPADSSFVIGSQLTVTVQTEKGTASLANAFHVNDFLRPSICKVDPTSAQPNQHINVSGFNFGDVQPDNSSVGFGNFSLNAVLIGQIRQWSNTLLQTILPQNVADVRVIKPYGAVAETRVTVLATHHSNTKDVLLEPFITSITPPVGAPNTWITIKGGNFGNAPGQNGAVLFEDVSGNPIIVNGTFGLPSYCGNNWFDSQIVVKVPQNARPGLVRVRTNAQLVTSDVNSRQFFVDTDMPIGPGLCVVQPTTVYANNNASITLRGDNLGLGANQQDTVVFRNNTQKRVEDQGESWQDKEINVLVPVNLSGDVFVQKQVQIPSGRQCSGVLIGEQCINGQFTQLFDTRVYQSNPLFLQVLTNMIPSTCLNGVKDAQEECDPSDPNDINSAVCSNSCQLLGNAGTGYCGDTIVQQPNASNQHEACDFGAANGTCQNQGCCTSQCQIIGPSNGVCGDGVVNQGDGEQCDNGALNGNSNCTIMCQFYVENCNMICGNGIIEECTSTGQKEECDGQPNCGQDCKLGATCQPNQTVCGQSCCSSGIACVNNVCQGQAGQCSQFEPNVCGNTCCPSACVNGMCPAQVHVLNVTPSPNAVNICRNTQLKVVFSHALNTSSIGSRLIIKDLSDDSIVARQFTFDEQTKELTILPSAVLKPVTQYQVQLQAGMTATNGNVLMTNFDWIFTTKSDICQISQIQVHMYPFSPVCEKTDHLVGYYNFDEAVNSLSVFDQSGKENHGVLVNPNDIALPRQNSQAGGRALASTTQNPVHMDLGDDADTRFKFGMTYSLWFRPQSTPSSNEQGHVLMWEGDETQLLSGIPFVILQGANNMLMRAGGMLGNATYTNIGLNTFHHLLLSISETGLVQTFMNGTLVSSMQRPVVGVSANNTYLRFGGPYGQSNKDWLSTTQAFDGLIDEIKIYNKGFSRNEFAHCSADLFSCAGDNCPFDANTQLAGNQHRYKLIAMDADEQELAATYQCIEFDDQDVFNASALVGDTIYVTSQAKNGVGSLVCQAIGQMPQSGSAQKVITITTHMCANPWSMIDDAFYFSTSYCADRGAEGKEDDLPLLIKTTITNPPQQPVKSECPGLAILRDVLLNNPDGNDAIGIRVLSNPQHLRPMDWYRRCAPNPGNPSQATIGGYRALVDGRTRYVFAGNIANQAMYTNVYVFSHSENASADLQNILNQIMQNVLFNTNIPSTGTKEQIARDVIRLGDIQRISELLEQYYQINGTYPTLDQGTFIPGRTYSTWPSWQVLGNQLGEQLPMDPLNQFNACPNYDDMTCWNFNNNPPFADPGGYVYSYIFGSGVQAQPEVNP